MPQLLGRRSNINKFFRRTENIAKWRRRFYNRCVTLTNRMYEQNRPPPTVEQLVVDTCQDLLNYDLLAASGATVNGVDSLSLFDALNDGRETFGIAPNVESMGVRDTEVVELEVLATPGALGREPHFFSAQTSGRIQGSFDQAPVFYVRQGPNGVQSVDFVRNLLPDNIYEQAAFALRIAIGPFQRPQEKGWIAIRLFPQGLPAVDRFFDELLRILRSIKEALNAITELIKRFIEFLQSRIIELQALLNRINGIIQSLLNLFISLPAAAGLVVIAPGTDGVLSALVSAQNKPFDSPNAYGGGVVLLAGGIPTIAIDLFKALVGGNG